jgi:hypothetical protein
VVLCPHLAGEQERVTLPLGGVVDAAALIAGGDAVPDGDVALEDVPADRCRGAEEFLLVAARRERHNGAEGCHAGESCQS